MSHLFWSRLYAHTTWSIGCTLLLCALLPLGCAHQSSPQPINTTSSTTSSTSTTAPKPAATQHFKVDGLSRDDFNLLCAELALPLYWREDSNQNLTLDPDELAVLTIDGTLDWTIWLDDGHFTARFEKAWAAIETRHRFGPGWATLPPEERERQMLLQQELSQGRPTLLSWDFRTLEDEDKALVTAILEASRWVAQIFLKQNGAFDMLERARSADPISRTVFLRNQGPWCQGKRTEANPLCNALPDLPPRRYGLYPLALQEHPDFCQELARLPNARILLDPFSIVTAKEDGSLAAVPYNEVYGKEMAAVAEALQRAAASIHSPDESAFKDYLAAAAEAFHTNDWAPADEAWARMNVHNSKWYLRIGPDETYFEPCDRKAGFHVSFARINRDSLAWQGKLEPVRQEMEDAMAALAGPPYQAREVSFHLPDFIDIILNEGDSRSPFGATVGQSLPNWGAVANEGRGRTVAMTNLYTDQDSKLEAKTAAESVLCPDAMHGLTFEPDPQIMSTVLHEAAHNLGPSHQYRVHGQTAEERFGGPLANTLEELKAQNAAFYFTTWLQERGLIDEAASRLAYKRDILWAMGNIANGMYAQDHTAKPYSQLAAIEVGYLLQAGGLIWHSETTAANGSDTGCFSFDMQVFPTAAETLTRKVLGIKARGDLEGARRLKARFVDADGPWQQHMATIRERWLRSKDATFVFSIRL